MSQLLLVLAVKAVNGGLFVVLFAVVGEVVQPKRFSGLFGAAPSVALGGLAVSALVYSRGRTVGEAEGMILGAAAMVAACIVAVLAVRRWRAVRGAGVMWLTWLVVATGAYWAVVR
ncbi:MAG TPA: hypothetical protein VMW47_04685 [Verrucomicrobiae bacterium]|nr:hypothetical protein [Verrucomicrobiae bacterium]